MRYEHKEREKESVIEDAKKKWREKGSDGEIPGIRKEDLDDAADGEKQGTEGEPRENEYERQREHGHRRVPPQRRLHVVVRDLVACAEKKVRTTGWPADK